MKKSLLALIIALPALADIAPPPGRPTPVPMPRPSLPVQIQETPVYLASARGISVRAGQPGSLVVNYTVTYSNSCVAGANTSEVLSVRKDQGASKALNVLIKANNRGLRIACPAVYKPVHVQYQSTIGNLTSGASYSVSVEGSAPATRVQVRVP
jgi:hypothetical protein